MIMPTWVTKKNNSRLKLMVYISASKIIIIDEPITV